MPKIINRIHNYLQKGRNWYQRPQHHIKKITIHHSAMAQDGRQTNDSVLQTIMNIHSGHGWAGLSYHFCIMPDGSIYQTNKFEDITWHDTINSDSIGVLVHGYFHPEVNDRPTNKQLVSLKELLDWLCTQNPAFPASQKDVVGHRERSATACPGNLLQPYVEEYRNKLGDVDWNAGTDCEKKLVAMEKNKDEWKDKARAREQEIKDLKKEIKEKEELIDKLRNITAELENQRNNANTDLVGYKNRVQELLEQNQKLESKLIKCQNNNNTDTSSNLISEWIIKIYETLKSRKTN
jgi:N-acetyl-anhydromuramyl-L-alanine amidase AmpD